MKAIDKDFAREVKKTRSRFLSIMVLAALAAAFLCGLRATAPDMKNTADAAVKTGLHVYDNALVLIGAKL